MELNGQGHRSWYVSLMIQSLDRLGLRNSARVVTRTEVQSTSAWLEHIQSHVHAGLVIETTKMSRRHIIRSAAADMTYLVVPDGDQWAWDLIRSRAFGGPSSMGCILLMRPIPDASIKSVARHVVKAILWKMARTVHPGLSVLSLVPAQNLPPSPKYVEDPIVYHPEDTTRAAWLTSRDLDPDKRWLIVLGELSGRKCLKEIAAAIDSESVRSAGWGLIAMGRADGETRKFLEEAARLSTASIVYEDRFLSDREFDTWVSVADVIAVLHKNEGSSGVLLKSWAAGTPVLVGGARTVIDAARSLEMNALSIEKVTSSSVALALLRFKHSHRSERAQQSILDRRNSQFAESLLGVRST